VSQHAELDRQNWFQLKQKVYRSAADKKKIMREIFLEEDLRWLVG